MNHPNYKQFLREEIARLDEEIAKRKKRVDLCEFRLREAKHAYHEAVKLREALVGKDQTKKQDTVPTLAVGVR